VTKTERTLFFEHPDALLQRIRLEKRRENIIFAAVHNVLLTFGQQKEPRQNVPFSLDNKKKPRRNVLFSLADKKQPRQSIQTR
jgi:hypothetical protein